MHEYEYGTTTEHLAELAVATRARACLDPRAYHRTRLTVEDVRRLRRGVLLPAAALPGLRKPRRRLGHGPGNGDAVPLARPVPVVGPRPTGAGPFVEPEAIRCGIGVEMEFPDLENGHASVAFTPAGHS